MSCDPSPDCLSAKEVAENRRCPVVLPALQRGAVWRAYQVEEIWDSLLRGFPIGSFLLTRIRGNEKLGQREILNTNAVERPEFYLLDGQQRWSAIALGFRNIWKSGTANNADDVRSALWIDLQGLPSSADGRLFLFRVTSRAHPWGFRRDNPRNRLEARQRREALAQYESVSSDAEVEFRPGTVPLRLAWPWDAAAPIPFAIIMEILEAGISGEQIWAEIERSMQSLSYWNADKLSCCYGDWKAKVLDILQNPGPFQRKLIEGATRVLGMDPREKAYRIPIQLLLS